MKATSKRALLFLLINIWLAFTLGANADDSNFAPFAIRVVDETTDRGVPLVELRTIPDQTYLTDSNGYVAIDDPTLLGQKVFFHISSHGYEYPQKKFGYRGITLQVEAGAEATIELKRLNIAQRLYRITGAGIYRDSVRLGKQVPIDKPLLNAFVCGQDSVQTVVDGDRIYWFWGDTDRLRHVHGHFNTSGALSLLPQAGGLDPTQGINLEYFTDASGFSRPMFERENGILIWVHGVFAVRGPDGQQKILTHYSRRKSLHQQLSHGLAVLNKEKHLFEPIVEYKSDEILFPRGHAFYHHEQNQDYIYFADPYAIIRVPATWEAVIDSHQYEAFSPLKTGCTKVNLENLDRTEEGKLNFAWKKNTTPIEPEQLRIWVRDKVIDSNENWLQTRDAITGTKLQLPRGSIHWNDYRKRWIMIANQSPGSSSVYGEIWYAEAKHPEGPFPNAIKIATHDGYSFYNVAHHEFFDQQQDRIIFFEGTYTNTFSKTKTRTPWYDYNQIMYQLDLTDPRLKPAFIE